MPELDTFKDGFYWAKTRKLGVWRLLGKGTERETWGQPWKDLESNRRITWSEIQDRYSDLVKMEHP